MTDIEEKDAQRSQLLRALYDESGGNPRARIRRTDIPALLPSSIKREDIDSIILFLSDEGLARFATRGSVSITHAGVRTIEKAIRKPNEEADDLPAAMNVNITNIDTMTNSQIQQSSPAASQTVQITPDKDSKPDGRTHQENTPATLGRAEAAGAKRTAATGTDRGKRTPKEDRTLKAAWIAGGLGLLGVLITCAVLLYMHFWPNVQQPPALRPPTSAPPAIPPVTTAPTTAPATRPTDTISVWRANWKLVRGLPTSTGTVLPVDWLRSKSVVLTLCDELQVDNAPEVAAIRTEIVARVQASPSDELSDFGGKLDQLLESLHFAVKSRADAAGIDTSKKKPE